MLLRRITRQIIEQIRDICTHGFITSEYTDIFVDKRRDSVVITGTKVEITANPLPFLADDHRHFAMGFKPHQSIHYMNTCLFQHFCPADITLFIEARLEFH